MNPPIKRLLAFAGSVAAGLFSVVVLANPAQAHHPIISGTADCQADGRYKIIWTVENGKWDNPFMKIKEMRADPSTAVDGITAGDTWIDPDQSVTGTQFVPGSTKLASLTVRGIWFTRKTDTREKVDVTRTGKVTLAGTCKAEPNPTATFTDRCDGTTNVHLVNPSSSKKLFQLKGGSIDQAVEVVAKSETDRVVGPNAGTITVSVKNGDRTVEIGKHEAWARPQDCPPPTVFSWSNCDTFKIAVTIPEKGQDTAVTVNYGTQPVQSKTVAAGKTGEFVFSPGSTTEAKVELTGWPTQTMTYEKPAEACETLPKTGPNTTTFVASGTGLAMLGGLAFFFARRRMVKLRNLASS